MLRSSFLTCLLLVTACRADKDDITQDVQSHDFDGDGFSEDDGDCNDGDATVFPNASELCDEVDNNCDGQVDETGELLFYIDDDADGYGSSAISVQGCSPPEGYVDNADDCDDTTNSVSPQNDEVCDSIDNDCDGDIDEDAAVDALTWYGDADGDGYGVSDVTQNACQQPEGFSATSTDCNDDDNSISPGSIDIANDGIDQNCDGVDAQATILEDIDSGDLIISEIMHDPTFVEDRQGEWFEVHNPTADAIDIQGLVVSNGSDGTFVIENHIMIQSQDYIVFAARESSLQNGGIENVDVVYDRDQLKLNNWGTIILKRADEVVFDQVNYNTIGEFPSANGASLNLGVLNAAQNDTAEMWCESSTVYGDGDLGTPGTVNDECDLDGDGFYPSDGDCDDQNPLVFPFANEICDGVDNDCDGLVDTDDDSITGSSDWYLDADSDGYGDGNSVISSCEQPLGYVDNDFDCDDSDATININTVWYMDSDSDGFGDATQNQQSCEQPIGYVNNPDDCDDADSTLNPNTIWYVDADSDGYGNSLYTTTSCTTPSGYVLNDLDCDDLVGTVNPAVQEVCDSIDNDCDGDIDDADSSVDTSSGFTLYQDSDADGFGNASVFITACSSVGGYVNDDTDCDDSEFDINPNASEKCDSVDNDCDGSIDEEVQSVWYADTDGDGYGDVAQPLNDCNPPQGYVADSSDCDDGSNTVFPGAAEICDSIDNDCDSLIDDDDTQIVGGATYYADADMDTYGDINSPIEACALPSGYVSDSQDCDDSDFMVRPNEREGCDDGIDQNCDGDLTSAYCDFALDNLNNQGIKISGPATTTQDVFGYTLSHAGDLNDDGIEDFAVGARFADGGNGANSGVTYVFYQAKTTSLNAIDADAILLGAADDRSSFSISGGTLLKGGITGDLNNDGVDDLLVNAITNAQNGADAGALYVVHGPISGTIDLPSTSNGIYYGETAGDQLGRGAVSMLGDVNADGFADILVGSYKHDGVSADSGAAYLLLGPATAQGQTIDAAASVALYGGLDQGLGYAVAGPGDVNGDGIDDALVSAYKDDGVDPTTGSSVINVGTTYLFHGQSGTVTWDVSSPDAAFTGENANDKSGYVINGAGDVDNDGFQDILIGAPLADVNGDLDGGAAYLVTENPTGELHLSNATAKFIREEIFQGTDDFQFGRSVSAAGDLDGDGFDDVVIGAKKSDRNGTDSGAVYVFFGPLVGTYSAPHYVIAGEVSGDEAGVSVSAIHDANGQPDLLIGGYKHNSLEGAAYMFWPF